MLGGLGVVVGVLVWDAWSRRGGFERIVRALFPDARRGASSSTFEVSHRGRPLRLEFSPRTSVVTARARFAVGEGQSFGASPHQERRVPESGAARNVLEERFRVQYALDREGERLRPWLERIIQRRETAHLGSPNITASRDELQISLLPHAAFPIGLEAQKRVFHELCELTHSLAQHGLDELTRVAHALGARVEFSEEHARLLARRDDTHAELVVALRWRVDPGGEEPALVPELRVRARDGYVPLEERVTSSLIGAAPVRELITMGASPRVEEDALVVTLAHAPSATQLVQLRDWMFGLLHPPLPATDAPFR